MGKKRGSPGSPAKEGLKKLSLAVLQLMIQQGLIGPVTASLAYKKVAEGIDSLAEEHAEALWRAICSVCSE